MATNKRKEAAALFELIDKSTLKIPKNAGALKIPSWWSSKANPAVGHSAPAPTSPAPAARPMPPLPASPSTPRPAPQARIPEPVEANPPAPTPAAPAPEPVLQHPLFTPEPELPPTPPASPSIRPPASSVPIPVSPSVKAPLPAAPPPPVVSHATPEASESPSARSENAPGPSAKSPRTFAPATHAASGTRTWAPRPGALARVPLWVKISGGTGIAILVLCLILISRKELPSSPTPAPAKSTDRLSERPIPPPSLLPRGEDPAPTPLPPDPAPPAAPTAARVYYPGEVSRSADLLYVVIATSPSKEIAERNAKFIADHGLAVSIETRNANGKLLYTLVSVDGFPTTTAAEPLRQKIVDIGHQTPDYKKTRKAWDDAMVLRVIKPASPGR